MLIKTFCFITVCVTLIEGLQQSPSNATSTPALQLTASPPSYLPGLTKTLTVNCSFDTAAQSAITDVMSLIVSKKSPIQSIFYEIAAVVSTNPDQVSIKSPTLNASADGHIAAHQAAYLTLQWGAPSTDAIEGRYHCEMFGSDRQGRPSVLVGEVDVSMDSTVTPSTLLGEIRALSSRLDAMEAAQTACNNRLQASMSAVFTSTASFGNHTYRLSRPMLRDITMHDHLCRLFGGYLLEIDTQVEYDFIEGWAMKRRGAGKLAIGISDRDQEGNFTFIASGHQAPVFRKGDLYNGDGDCAELWALYGDGYVDDKCTGGSLGGNEANLFVCEFPN